MRVDGRRVGAALVAFGLLGVGGGAWAADDHGHGGSDHEVVISHARFVPQTITVAVGESVLWHNEDHDAHSVTADDGSFDSHPSCTEDKTDACLAPDGTWTHTFTKAGRYSYHSKTEGQKGVVVVK